MLYVKDYDKPDKFDVTTFKLIVPGVNSCGDGQKGNPRLVLHVMTNFPLLTDVSDV